MNFNPIRSPLDLVAPSLSLIPIVGGPVSTLWSQWDSNRRFERVEQMLDELKRQIEKNKSFFAAEQLTDKEMELLEIAIGHVQHTFQADKRKLFARLVASSWIQPRTTSFDENVHFLDALNSFNETHLSVLRILRPTGLRGSYPYNDLKDQVIPATMNPVDGDSILVAAIDLLASRFGFVKRAWGLNDPEKKQGSLLVSNSFSPEGIARGCRHAITALGERFMASLRDEEDR